MGVDTPKCYHAMPVALEEEDLAKYAEFAGLTKSQAANVTFFVEPYTRVLTTTAAEAPCVPGLSPMYEALNGSWVQAAPTLQRMTGPHAINSSEFMDYYYNGSSYYPVPNFAQSGIYRTETLQKFQMYRQGPRYEAAAVSSIRDAWLGASHPSGEDTSGGARSFFGAYQMVGDASFEDVLNNVEVYSRLKQMWDAWGTWQTWCVAGFALWVAWKLLNIVSGALIRLLGSRALSPWPIAWPPSARRSGTSFSSTRPPTPARRGRRRRSRRNRREAHRSSSRRSREGGWLGVPAAETCSGLGSRPPAPTRPSTRS